MYINKVQYNWKRKAGFCISVPVMNYYNLFVFHQPTQIKVDGVLVNAQANACIWSKPTQERWFFMPEDGAISWLHAYKEIAPILKEFEMPVGKVFYPEDPELVLELLKRMHREFRGSGEFQEQMMDHLTYALLIALSRNDGVGNEIAGVGHADIRKLRKLRNRLLSQPESAWNVESMAREVSLSTSRFHAVYKTLFGTTPGQDMIRGRMDYAKSLLLLDERISISAVAEQLGYSSQYHFIRQFKQITGITPGAYRKNK